MQEIFFECFFSLVRLFLDIEDDFLQEKLFQKTKEFFNSYNHVVQSSDNKLVAQSIYNLQELIEILVHLKLISLPPALSAQKNLLRLQSEIISFVQNQNKKLIPKSRQASSLPKVTSQHKHSYLKEKIVEYLKNGPNGAQAKELADNFKNQLSRRSLQRYLNELVASGLIKKEKVAGFPKYFLL